MNHKQQWSVLKALLNQAEFKFKGDAVVMAATAINWFNSLDKVLEQIDKQNEKPKEIDKPLKKVKDASK